MIFVQLYQDWGLIKLFNYKTIFIIILTITTSGIFIFFNRMHHVNNYLNLSCSAKGILSVNGYTLNYVSSYRFKNNGRGATTLTGKIQSKDGELYNIGLQFNFNYDIESGVVMLKTTNIVSQVENTASEEVIKRVFPPIYYKINSVHNVAIVKMGSGYRFDFNTYPIMYCY